METMLFIWIAGVITKVAAVIWGIVITLLVLLTLSLIDTAIHNSVYDNKKSYPFQKRWGKISTTAVVLLSLLAASVPSERTMYMMAAGFAGQKVIQSETADKVVKILNGKLDEYLAEIEEKTKK
jgi:hypothetical protein